MSEAIRHHDAKDGAAQAEVVGAEAPSHDNQAAGVGNDVSRLQEQLSLLLPEVLKSFMESHAGQANSKISDTDELRAELENSRKAFEVMKAEKERIESESFLREQLRGMGITNTDLAVRAVREEIRREADGRWVAIVNGSEVPAQQFLRGFVHQNPELIPARRTHGNGVSVGGRDIEGSCDLDEIRPGMAPDSMKRARDAVMRIIAQSKRSL